VVILASDAKEVKIFNHDFFFENIKLKVVEKNHYTNPEFK